jgi:LCP family protein required for cell wall assembly
VIIRAVTAARRSAVVAAFLSFLLPGLGQGWLGRFRRGLVLATPVLALIGFAIGLYIQEGRLRTLGILLQPRLLLPLLLANVALLLWRIGAILDAFRLAPRGPGPRSTLGIGVLVLLLVATLVTHLGAGYLGLKTYATMTAIFVTPEPSPTLAPTPLPSPGPSLASQRPSPRPTPQPTPVPAWSADGRLDVLLVGGDAGPGRRSLRTDSMIMLSVDLATGRAALSGIPRNLVNVPLPAGPASLFPQCECYPDLLNSLFVFANNHPDAFRGGEARGYLALQDAVSEMTGQPLDGMVVVTLQGFVRLVDALGGLDMTTPENLYDAAYPDEDGIHHEELWIPAGQHHFDGHAALAYARSRHQDSDYNRMERQQLVLTALRRQVCPGDLVFRIPELLDIARDSLWTNLPVEELPDLLGLGNRVHTDSLAKHQFWPPDIPEYLTRGGIDLIRTTIANPWGPEPTPLPSGQTPLPTPVDTGC